MRLMSASGSTFSSVAGMTLAETRRELADVRRQQAVLNSRVLELVSHLESLAAADTPEITLTHHELMTHAGLTPREATATIARAEVADVAPEFGTLLATGAASTGHLDAMARAFATLGDERHKIEPLLPELASAAESMTVGDFTKLATRTARSLLDDGGLSTFEKQRASTHLTMKRDTDGGFRLSGYLDPERGAALVSAIETRRETAFHTGDPLPTLMPWITPNEHRNALALIDLVAQASALGFDGPTTPRAEVVVHIDLTTLTTGLHEHTDCRTVYGANIPAHTARRLACDAHLRHRFLDPSPCCSGVHCRVERLAHELGDLFGCCQPLVHGVDTPRKGALCRLGLV